MRVRTLQQHGHQRRAVAVLGLLDQELPVVQDVGNRVAPLDDAVHDVAGIILLVRSERLRGARVRTGPSTAQKDCGQSETLLTGLMSLLSDPMKSARVTCSFSARSMSTSTVDVACRRNDRFTSA